MTNRIEKLLYFLSINPSDTFSLYALALEYKKMGSYDKAVSFLHTCVETEPHNLASYYQLCEIFILMRDKTSFNDYIKKAKDVALLLNDNKTLNELDLLEDEFN